MVKDEKMEYLLKLDITENTNEFTEKFPVFCDFIPSTVILRQLIKRMI